MIRIGIGGWTYEPWRGRFYPQGLVQKKELEFASRAVTAIEINGTYYGRQKPESFAAWARTAHAGFVFSVKGSSYCPNRRLLDDTGDTVQPFVDQGIIQLRAKRRTVPGYEKRGAE